METTTVFHKTVIHRAALAALFLSATLSAFAGPGSVDTTFNVVVNNTVYSVLTQPDGKILIGGVFTQVAGVLRNGLARLFPDGTPDTSYSNSISGQGTIYAMVMQPDGKLLIAGAFQGLQEKNQNIVRLNVNGTIDQTFSNSAPNAAVFALGLQSDGKVLIGGQFTSLNNSNRNIIARLNPDGTMDTTFNPGLINGSAVNAIAVQDDGNILIGGQFESFTTYGLTRNSIARLLTNGTPDLAYQPSASGAIQCVYLQSDGKSVWGGPFTGLDLNNRGHVGRLNADGTLDGGFTALIGANNTVYALTEDTNDNIYIGGLFAEYNNAIHEGVARVFSDGTVDSAFNSTTTFITPQVRCLAIQGDGKVLVGGSFTSFNSIGRTNLVRLYGDNYPAEITKQPQAQNVVMGGSATFSVEVSNPTSPGYQWRKNGVDIPGATFSEYSIFNAQPEDMGNYSVFVNTAFGGTTSSNALLQIGVAPLITQQPTNFIVIQGQTAVDSVTATGSPLNYYWFKSINNFDVTPVASATNAILNLTNATPSEAGMYFVVVSNFVGSVTSAPAVLSVLAPVSNLSGPTVARQSVHVGELVTFSIVASGNPLSYQWLKNGNAVAGATNSSYSITNVMLTDAGAYGVVVSNQFNSITSSNVNLSVGVGPQALQFHLDSNRNPVIQMPGTPGFGYMLQTTTNLGFPIVWQTVSTIQTDTNGVWTFTDTNQTSSNTLFYRVMAP